MKRNVVGIICYVPEIDSVLIGRKNIAADSFLAGKLHLPGETIFPGESDIAAVVRGILEEASIAVRVNRYLATYETDSVIVKWYECTPLSLDIQAAGDLDQVFWIKRRYVLSYLDPVAIAVLPYQIKEYLA